MENDGSSTNLCLLNGQLIDFSIQIKAHYSASQDLELTLLELAEGLIITIALEIGEFKKSLGVAEQINNEYKRPRSEGNAIEPHRWPAFPRIIRLQRN